MAKRKVYLEKDQSHHLEFDVDDNTGEVVGEMKHHHVDGTSRPVKAGNNQYEDEDDSNKKIKLKFGGKNNEVLSVSDGTIIKTKGSGIYWYFLNGRWYRVVVK